MRIMVLLFIVALLFIEVKEDKRISTDYFGDRWDYTPQQLAEYQDYWLLDKREMIKELTYWGNQ